MEHIVDSDELLKNLLEIIQLSADSIKKEIISILPDIVDELTQEKAVDSCLELLSSNSQMIAPVVDSLSNFPIGGELMVFSLLCWLWDFPLIFLSFYSLCDGGKIGEMSEGRSCSSSFGECTRSSHRHQVLAAICISC